MSNEVAIFIGVLLLAANAYFVGAEFAILSARRSAMEPLAASGDKRAKTVIWAMEHVSLMLAACQLGVTVCSVSLGVIAEPAVAKVVEPLLELMHVPHALVHPIAFVIALIVVVYLHVVVGEMVPKNMSVSSPDKAVLLFGPPLVWIARAVKPIIVVLNWAANHFVRWSGVDPKDEVASTFTAQEVQSIVEHSQAEGSIRDEQGLLSGALEFSAKKAEDVMVPYDQLVSVPEGFTPADVERLVAQTGFSRFPVVRHEREITGYIHVKDVLYAPEDQREEPLARYRYRNLAVSACSDEVEDSLVAMQHSGAHLARVLKGSTTVGVIFLEDILEELVGEVRDSMQRGAKRG
ncbi:hemolysin family protein [Timonella sp. A28]|uniref:hemolysin family protein n=1 Tax=Timonella sp. A28 TaxID=3442640 RepID=UPI003EBB4D3F